MHVVVYSCFEMRIHHFCGSNTMIKNVNISMSTLKNLLPNSLKLSNLLCINSKEADEWKYEKVNLWAEIRKRLENKGLKFQL